MKTQIKILAYALTVSMLTGCTQFKAAFSDLGSALGLSEKPQPPVAFMSSEQMLKGMISTAGIEGLGEVSSEADDLIAATYAERSGSLPSIQSIYQANGPTMIAVTNLASSVCAKAVDRDRATGLSQGAERMFFREVDFTKGPAAMSAEGVSLGFGRLARNAWRREPTADETAAIMAFAQEFSGGANGSDPAQTRLLAIGVCTAALSQALIH